MQPSLQSQALSVSVLSMTKLDDYPSFAAYKAAFKEQRREAGRKGGAARAKALSKKERSAIASLGGKAKQAKRNGA